MLLKKHQKLFHSYKGPLIFLYVMYVYVHVCACEYFKYDVQLSTYIYFIPLHFELRSEWQKEICIWYFHVGMVDGMTIYI